MECVAALFRRKSLIPDHLMINGEAHHRERERERERDPRSIQLIASHRINHFLPVPVVLESLNFSCHFLFPTAVVVAVVGFGLDSPFEEVFMLSWGCSVATTVGARRPVQTIWSEEEEDEEEVVI